MNYLATQASSKSAILLASQSQVVHTHLHTLLDPEVSHKVLPVLRTGDVHQTLKQLLVDVGFKDLVRWGKDGMIECNNLWVYVRICMIAQCDMVQSVLVYTGHGALE